MNTQSLSRRLFVLAVMAMAATQANATSFALPLEDKPATVAEAAKVLDLRTVDLPKEATVASPAQVGQLTYEVALDPKKAFEFHRAALLKSGWKELPGTTTDTTYANGMFSKSGFTLSCSTSSNGREGADAASYVSLFNFGNVALDKIPVIKGASSMFSNEASASYVTEIAVPDAAEQMLKLLQKDGWKFFGTNPLNDEQHFITVRKNAVQLSLMVAKAPAQGNKTMISISSLVLSAEIPVPDSAKTVQFDGQSKTVRYAIESDFADVSKFYSGELKSSGWKSTTEDPAESDDEFGRATAIQVFRNKAQDLMSIEMRRDDDGLQVTASFMTKEDLKEAEEKAREAAQIAKAEKEKFEAVSNAAREEMREELEQKSAEMDALADSLIADALGGGKGKKKLAANGSSKSGKNNAGKDKAGTIVVQVPKGTQFESAAENVLKVTVAGGKGLATAKSIAEKLESDGWKIEDKNLTDSSGNYSFKGDKGSINLTFVDTGFTDVTMMVIGVDVELSAEEMSDEPAPKSKAKGKK